jgi:hypothetical protein
MSKLLLLGTALDGPVNDPITVTPNNTDYILNLFGNIGRDLVYLSPTGTTLSLSTESNSSSIMYYPLAQYNFPYPSFQFPLIYGTTGGVSLGPIPLSIGASGWIEYTPKLDKRSLVMSIKQALSQTTFTSVEQIDVLRVIPDNQSYSNINFGTFSWKYLYPSKNGNNIKINISTTQVEIFAPPNQSTIYKYADFKSVYDLYTKIDSDNQVGLTKVKLALSPDQYFETCVNLFSPVTGSYQLTGGVASPTSSVSGYINSLNRLNLSDYDVIAFPGMYGREIFPYLSYFTDTGFPALFVCGASGTTLSELVTDCYQHRQFVAVYGECSPNIDSPQNLDLTTTIATTLASELNYYSSGSNLKVNVLSSNISSVPEKLNKYGISTLLSKNGVYVTGKVLSTDTSTSPVVTAVCKRFLREFYTLSVECIGKSPEISLAIAQKALDQTFTNIADENSPILDYAGQVQIVSNELQVAAEFQLAGVIDTISVSSSVPISVISGG